MIETERLRIRNFVSEDSKSCFESWGKDKDLGKYILPNLPKKLYTCHIERVLKPA